MNAISIVDIRPNTRLITDAEDYPALAVPQEVAQRPPELPEVILIRRHSARGEERHSCQHLGLDALGDEEQLRHIGAKIIALCDAELERVPHVEQLVDGRGRV